VEHNTLRLSGILEKQHPVRVSPAGVPQQDLLVAHRSLQREAGLPREARASVTVHLAGDLVRQASSLVPGDRVLVEGFLAMASHRDTDRLVLHAQTLNKQD